jgi:hypothetical protein
MKLRLTLLAAAAAVLIGLLGSAAPAGAAPPGDQPFIEFGDGTARPDPCLDGREGRCGFEVKGTLTGTPVEGTFYSVVYDDGAANPDRCVRARYAGIFGAGPDESIGHTARGQLCPDGAGGFTFEGTYRITGGLGSFDGAFGKGPLLVQLPADGSSVVFTLGWFGIR